MGYSNAHCSYVQSFEKTKQKQKQNKTKQNKTITEVTDTSMVYKHLYMNISIFYYNRYSKKFIR